MATTDVDEAQIEHNSSNISTETESGQILENNNQDFSENDD